MPRQFPPAHLRSTPFHHPVATLVLCSVVLLSGTTRTLAAPWRVGFSKVDITPDQPVRLSGYSIRTESHVGVADPLHVRVMVISPAAEDQSVRSVVLASVESIAVTSSMTVEIANWLENQYGIPREQLVLCSTHTHAAPQLASGVNNLYLQPSTKSQQLATERYTTKVISRIKQAIEKGMDARIEAVLSIGTGEAGFAVDRRLIKNGTWTGFGEQQDGPVDHRVRVMRVTSADGMLLGASFMYACHCTTLGPSFNRISGDWAGLSASRLELLHEGAIFVPVIGCGADANPSPRESYEFAQRHAAEMVDSVNKVIAKEKLQSIEAFPKAQFGYAGLVPEQPTAERLESMRTSDQPNQKRWAEQMLKVLGEMGRLPETCPMPIHTWQFGDELTWVFLGGEVVVDYQFQIEKELPTKDTWVASYADDVFGYVASESMRSEGGYEVDFSMIYYLLPGRWESGTEALIVRRTAEIFKQQRGDSTALSVAEALDSIRVPEGFKVDVVVAEPLVQDPINVAFGPDGRVWVVEMADYPRGVDGGGRVKWLRDSNQDGRLDKGKVFIDDLSYPTGVMPWKDGILIIAAPEVLFARDTNGDGTADKTETMLTGFAKPNPQHRASGFEMGLDGWLHMSIGDSTKTIESPRSGKSYSVAGHDIAWNPESGEIRRTTGKTQFIRARDAFGNWFGNSNSYPIFQYVIDSRYLHDRSVSGGPIQHLLSPAVAPPVYPRSRTVDRFNDLFALNRFTSACGSIVCRVPGIELQRRDTAEDSAQSSDGVGFICEPVHNLVARVAISRDGSTFTADRHPEDTEFDFFTSTDPWSRPVRAINAPDGTVWIVDMVRRIIEHPEWIPTAWQDRLNLRSGSRLGRIYRVYRDDFEPTPLVDLSQSSTRVLDALKSDNGALRDLASLQIVSSGGKSEESVIRNLARQGESDAVRASALGTLASRGWLQSEEIIHAFSDGSVDLVRCAIELSEQLPDDDQPSQESYQRIVERNLGPQVDLQWVLTSTVQPKLDATAGLRVIAERSMSDRWVAKALTLVRGEQEALTVMQAMLSNLDQTDWSDAPSIDTQIGAALRLWKIAPAAERKRLAEKQLAGLNRGDVSFRPSDVLLLTVLAREAGGSPGEKIKQVAERGRARMLDDSAPEAERIALMNLIGASLRSPGQEIDDIRQLLETGSRRIRRAAIDRSRSIADDRVTTVLLDAWSNFGTGERQKACTTLLSKPAWAKQLVSHLEQGDIVPTELDMATIQRLRSYPDRSLRSRCIEVFGKPTDRSTVVAKYLEEMPAPVKTDLGQKLYKEHCSVCHQAKEDVPAIGPPIENLGHWTNSQWVTAIMDPNQAVEPKYKQSSVLTTDDLILSGIVVSQTAQTLMIAGTDGRIQEINSSDVESMKDSGISLMPEGFEVKLSPEQLSKLLGYLRDRR